MLAEAAHSAADTLNQVFLLTSVHQGERPAETLSESQDGFLPSGHVPDSGTVHGDPARTSGDNPRPGRPRPRAGLDNVRCPVAPNHPLSEEHRSDTHRSDAGQDLQPR
jgi:hypothetical protein